MHKYKLHGKKGEGTFSEVLKAQDIKTGKLVAIKCMKNHFDSVEQVNRLREIQALRRLSPHPNIIKLHEVLYDRSTGRLALVFELMEMNIYEMIRHRKQYLPDDKILHFMYQLVKGIDHMHKNGIFHRDIKPENILVLNDALKLADFGSCRGIYSKQPFTEYISTRWYRAPECLLTDGYYNYKMDVWGVGCVFFEIMSLYPLFPGTNELDQIHKIHNILGTPPVELLNRLKKHGTHMDFDFPQKPGTGIVKLLPHASPDALDLMQKLLIYNPDDRISAKQALRHGYFKEIRELDKRLRKASKMQQQTSSSSSSSSTKEVASMSASGSLNQPVAASPSSTVNTNTPHNSEGQHKHSTTKTSSSSNNNNNDTNNNANNDGGGSSLNSSINVGGGGGMNDTNSSMMKQATPNTMLANNGGKLPSLGGGGGNQQSSSSNNTYSSGNNNTNNNTNNTTSSSSTSSYTNSSSSNNHQSSSGITAGGGGGSSSNNTGGGNNLPSLAGAPSLGGGGGGPSSSNNSTLTNNPYSLGNNNSSNINSSAVSSTKNTSMSHYSNQTATNNNTGLHLNGTLSKKPQSLASLNNNSGGGGGGDLPKLGK